MNNVLSNAVKFTPDGGTIWLRCETDGKWLTIVVQDSGAGIAPQFLPFVFDRFRQGDSRSTRIHGGLGLGLAIARHLVEQHGGRISAHSDGEGLGTTLSIRVPVCVTRSDDVTVGTSPHDVAPAIGPRIGRVKSMEKKRLQIYETPAVTVTFDPTLCQHTGICLRGLPNVFDIRERRWVRPELASAAEVMAQVARCPSGALQIRPPGAAAPSA